LNRAEIRRLAIVSAPGLALVLAVAALVALLGDGGAGAGDSGGPKVGDHWHAPYAIFVGDELQPRIQDVVTQQGVHTHGDGVIHIHPHISVAEGSGARLEHFFGDQGGKLSDSEMRIPGRRDTYKNGDDLDGDGKPEELRILRADSGIHPLGVEFAQAVRTCNAKPASEFDEVGADYVPQDGDCIRIVFGPAAEE